MEGGQRPDDVKIGRLDTVIFVLVGLAAAITWFGIVPRVHGVDVIAVIAVLGGGYPVFRETLVRRNGEYKK